MNKKLIISLGIVGLIVAGVLWYSHDSESSGTDTLGMASTYGNFATSTDRAYDVIGTRVGTTTTGTGFYHYTTVGTTTYPWRIGLQVDSATFYFRTTAASSSGTAVSFNILASNDIYCNTATNTTIYDMVTIDDVNWYDAAPFLLNKDGSTTLTATTTTFYWAPLGPDRNRVVPLVNLNAECLALRLNASSTVLHVQMVTDSSKGY